MKQNKVKLKNIRVELDDNGHGVSLFVNGRWVVDASCFGKDLQIRVDETRLKVCKRYTPGTKFDNAVAVYEFVGDDLEKEIW